MDGFAIVFLIIIVVFVVMAIGAAQRRGVEEAWSRVALNHGGRCEPGGVFGRAKVRFHHDDAWVVIDVHSTGGEHPTYYTQAHFHHASPRYPARCVVYPEGVWAGVRKFFGMEDIEIGAPDFDDRYIIQGNSASELRGFLNPEAQRQIDALRRFLGNEDIYISTTRKEMLIKKRSYIKDYDSLARFVDLALGLYDRGVRPLDEGIEFVEGAPAPDLAEAVCQICGERIESEPVFCRRCKTPHHQDCWEYYGACSTYGCMEKRYLRPQSFRARRATEKLRQETAAAAASQTGDR